MRSNSKYQGFSLIELLIVVLIVGFGVAGVVSLQATFVKKSNEANGKAIALQLAQEKIDEFRSDDTYSDIVDGSDGSAITRNNFNFTRSWDVTDQYYVDTDADDTADSWLDAGDAGLPASLPSESHQKNAVVTVSWNDTRGNAQSVTLSTLISPVTMMESGESVTDLTDRADPQLTYTPGIAPEVIAIDLKDGSADAYDVKETTKPTPEVVQQADSNLVQFESVIYDQSTQTQSIEDFATVNCTCQMAGTGTGYTPSYTSISGSQLVITEGTETTKNVGTVVGSQNHDLCTTCCRDHHDDTASVAAGIKYVDTSSRDSSGDHYHYYNNGDGTFTQAGSTDQYHEACRFQRIDGYYRLMPDWQLKTVTLMSSSFLVDATNQENYISYVKDYVKSEIMGTSAPSKPSGRDESVSSGAYQMIARSVYLDPMSNADISYVQGLINDSTVDWLEYVPFYEINLTLLADWSSDDTTVAPITNEDVQTVVDPVNDYYGTYSRGRVNTGSAGTANLTVSVYDGSGGVAGANAIRQTDIDSVQTDTIAFTVTASSGGVNVYAATGEINCLNDSGGACNNNERRSVSVSISDLNLSCSYDSGSNNQTPYYTCNDIPENWSGNITFSKSGFTFTPATVTINNMTANNVQNIQMQEN